MTSAALAALALLLLAAPAPATTPAPAPAPQTPTVPPAPLSAPAPPTAGTHHHARGTFDVKLTPQGEGDRSDGATTARMTADKQYHGDLEGIGKGEMLSALSDVKGSGSYVAIERVSGTLNGRQGTFILDHRGRMTRGAQQLEIAVVPDSGTGALTDITGTMTITIAGGKHSYEFEYTLAGAP
jgi:uncharacterized protein DUF3224